jgi:hypothetical protein
MRENPGKCKETLKLEAGDADDSLTFYPLGLTETMDRARQVLPVLVIALLSIGCATEHQQQVIDDRRAAEQTAWEAKSKSSNTNFGPLIVGLGNALGSCLKK